MADRFSKRARSIMMGAIRTRGTAPELVVRALLKASGQRYRSNCKGMPGKPDLVVDQKHLAFFVHGCFWHLHPNCKKATLPKSNRVFWRNKLQKNVEQDTRNRRALFKQGWKTIVIWECELATPDKIQTRLKRHLGPSCAR